MRTPHSAIAILLPLIAISRSPKCSGFAAGGQPNHKRRKTKKDFPAKVMEDVVVRDVASKVRSNKKVTSNMKTLNSRQRSFSQRDPIRSLNMNLDYLAKSSQRGAAERCEEMLMRIEALHKDGYYEKSPDVVSYNCVINAYAHGRSVPGNKDCSRSDHAKRLMTTMEEKELAPNSITYNTLLRCILKDVGDKQRRKSNEVNIEEAESILCHMEQLDLANTISFNTVLSIISKSGMDDAAERAEGLLQRMLELYETTQNGKIQPDTTSFNAVIHSYANIGKNYVGAPERARKAEALIQQMETLYGSGGNDNCKPDVVTYSAVLNAFSRAAAQEGACAFRALELLEHMSDLSEEGDTDVKPNKRTYTAVINAFARAGKPELADDLLLNMKKSYELGDASLKPDTVCYSSVLDAYAKKGGEESAFRAEELLHEMEDLYNSGDTGVKPNTRTYRSVITALGKSRQPQAAEKAEHILEEMEYISQHGAKDLAPNTIVYNAVIDAFARSRCVSKAYRAELLLEKMLEETEKGNVSIRPDTITFNSVINAAARSTTGDAIVRKEAFLIGLNAFRSVHTLEYCKPSPITYVSYLKLLYNLVERGDERDGMAERVFGISSSLDLATVAVKTQLRKTCTHLAAQRILSSHNDSSRRERQ